VTGLEILLLVAFGTLYFALVATVAVVTFQKGHVLLFVLGFFLPFVWLIGAMMAPKPGSNYRGRL
jgi:hypothetical protein